MSRLLLHEAPAVTIDRAGTELDNDDYTKTYQPTYPDQGALQAVRHQLRGTAPLTTPERVDSFQEQLTALAEGAGTPLGVTGNCNEPIRDEMPVAKMVAEHATARAIVGRTLGPLAIYAPRAGAQSTKPRSAGPQRMPDGTLLYPYMGDGVNGEDEHERTPDPRRMIAMAEQARRLRTDLEAVTGVRIAMAHEALLLPYEQSLVRIDPATGKQYLLSTELPWAGVRTNGLESGPIALLAEVENPRAVKIGPNTKPGDIQKLVERLNPTHVPGKLIFMLRTGPDNLDVLDGVLQEINTVAPESLTVYDIHGVTRPGKDGIKIRAVPEIIDDIKRTSVACGRAGLKLHGVHLESMGDNNRLECVDRSDQLPTHPGGIDPQLNPRQLELVLGSVAAYLL
jgi:3-deoxy-7-phosphoheptulonate synthase